jgi:uncharacterized protein (DUF433 family)
MKRKRALLLVKGVGNPMQLPTEDRRLRPRYTIEEAADYLSIPRDTLRAWTFGRRKAGTEHEYYPSVLEFVNHEQRLLSFYDLVEAHILRAAVECHMSLKQVRRGLAYLKSKHPNQQRPLLTLNFYTEGKYLLVGGMLGSRKKDREALVNASMSGQLEITPVIEDLLTLIGRDEHQMPNTLFPKEGGRIVSITTGILSGRPVIEGTRIPTSIIAQRVLAGESPSDLAEDYRLPLEKIEAAIKYEKTAA